MLEKEKDASVEIATFLYRWEEGRLDRQVNSLQKKKIGIEMRMNVQIDEYDVDLVILDLGSYVNIITKRTWEMMGNP